MTGVKEMLKYKTFCCKTVQVMLKSGYLTRKGVVTISKPSDMPLREVAR